MYLPSLCDSPSSHAEVLHDIKNRSCDLLRTLLVDSVPGVIKDDVLTAGS
jgi:hypothetical protein